MTHIFITNYLLPRAFAALAVVSAIVLVTPAIMDDARAQQAGNDPAYGDGSQTFDSGFTERTVDRGNDGLGNCQKLPLDRDRKNCVAEELRKIARRLERRGDYKAVAKVFRETADKVEAAPTVAAAIAVLTVAKKSVLRAYGDKHHLQRLATLMDTAKSVLRS